LYTGLDFLLEDFLVPLALSGLPVRRRKAGWGPSHQPNHPEFLGKGKKGLTTKTVAGQTFGLN
jgi:hypothetical protein